MVGTLSISASYADKSGIKKEKEKVVSEAEQKKHPECANQHWDLLPTDSLVVLDERGEFRCRNCNSLLWTPDYRDVRNKDYPFTETSRAAASGCGHPHVIRHDFGGETWWQCWDCEQRFEAVKEC